ncbi:MAG: PAS domain-containing protein, partial [Bacteroidetes bacterium]|nr:PAS domain-containing protein [Bacteroidota bacterium]MBU1720773.1 PAS domain-containing protein [Bacteroidota bacterium]
MKLDQPIQVLLLEDVSSDAKNIFIEIRKSYPDALIEWVDSIIEYERLIVEFAPDIILSKHCLQDHNSFEIIDIRNQKAPLTPVVIISDTIGEEQAVEVIKYGANDYLLKDRLERMGIVITRELGEAVLRIEFQKNYTALKQAQKIARLGYFEWNWQTENGYCSDEFWSIMDKENANADFILDDFISIVHPDDLKMVESEVKKAITNKSQATLEFRIHDIRGDIIHIECLATNYFDHQDRPLLVQGVIRDISQRINNERVIREANKELKRLNDIYRIQNEELAKAKANAEESDHLKAIFLQNISHEIRTPMNGIVGFSSLLSETKDNSAKIPYYTQQIISQTNRLLHTVDSIVQISSIEASRTAKKEKQLELYAFMNNIARKSYLLSIDSGKPISFFAGTFGDLDGIMILTDEYKLEQIFLKIIDNAFKFTANGFIELNHKITDQEILFSIKDSGIGIPGEKHQMIFESFRQGEESLSRNHGGMGIGLTIARKYVEMLGGKIWFSSSPGVGTTFFFTIPLAKKSDTLEPTKKEAVRETWEGKTVLVAEDDDGNFFLAK